MARVPIATLKGPQGEDGPRGLPGMEGVPTDAALGQYLNTWTARDTASGLALAQALESSASTVGTIPPKLPRGRIISRFQPGHTWANNAGGWLPFTDIVAHGSQSWGFDSTSAAAENHVTRMEFPAPINIVGQSVLVRAYIEDPTKVSNFIVTMDSGATGNSNTTSYPTMSVRAVDGGKWWDFLFAYGSAFNQIGTPDRTSMKRIGITIRTSAAIKVRFNSVELVSAPETLPTAMQKVVILESDDGDGTNALMHKVMSEYGARGTINMIAENMDRANRLSYAQLKSWQRNDGWDVQAHAYYLTTQNFPSLTLEQLDKELALLRAWCRRYGFQGDFIIYPQGLFNDNIRAIAAKYFRGGRTVYTTPVTVPGVRPYAISALSVQNTNTVASVTAYMDQVVNSGGAAHIVFHHWVEGDAPAGDPIGWGTNQLRAVIEYGIAQGYTFATYSEVYGTR